MWANFRLPVCFHIFFGLIVKQIFEEKGKIYFHFSSNTLGGC